MGVRNGGERKVVGRDGGEKREGKGKGMMQKKKGRKRGKEGNPPNLYTFPPQFFSHKISKL